MSRVSRKKGKGRYQQQDIAAMLEKIQRGSCRRRVEDEVEVYALCAASISVSQTRATRVKHCALPMLKRKSGSKTFCGHQRRRKESKMPRRKHLAPRNNKHWYPLGAVKQRNEKSFSRTASDVQECDLGRDCQPWRMESSSVDWCALHRSGSDQLGYPPSEGSAGQRRMSERGST